MLRWRNTVKKLMTAIAVLMVAAACSFVTTSQEVEGPWSIPTITRADTRDFARDGLRYTREVDIIYMWTLSQLSLPNEVAFCLYGHAVDTTITYRSIDTHEPVELDRKIAIVDSVWVANIEEATPTYVKFRDEVACDPNPRLIGTAHTHTNVPHPAFNTGQRCTHSDMDVLYAQNRETDYWFTLVLCQWTHELMWADGRRVEYWVQNPANPLQDLPDDHPDLGLSSRTDVNGNGG